MSKAHYADSDEQHIQQAKHRVANLVANAKGKENAISSKELANRVGLKPTTVRDLIPEIRKQYGVPVASSNRGYYRIVEKSEFLEVMQRIEDTIATKKERQRELAKAWNGENGW